MPKLEENALKEYVSGKLPFKDERELVEKLQLLPRIGLRIALFERRWGLKSKLLVWAIVLAVSASAGYWWTQHALPGAAIESAISHDLEFVRYRGNGLAIVYDNNLNETGRAQLNLSYFYGIRIGFSVFLGAALFYLFRRSYVPPLATDAIKASPATQTNS